MNDLALFDEQIDGRDDIIVFSKKIKENEISKDRITRKIDKRKLLGVIYKLIELGKEKDMENLELKDNCKEWVHSLLNEFPSIDENYLKYLINDFTDSMKTRMREEEKYAVAVLWKGGLFLCHSYFGEETITPQWQVIQRMIDRDNVMRYVFFKKTENSIRVIYYEKYRSESFVNWLGLSSREAFYYLGGNYRFYCDVGGVRLAFEFTEEELDAKIFSGKSGIKLEEGQLIFSRPIERLPISQIRVGRKRYEDVTDFLQDFLAQRYNLLYYVEKYEELASSFEPLTYKFFDERDRVAYIDEEGREVAKIFKRNPNFYILFVNERIEMRSSFLNEIFAKFINCENIRIFHAGMRLSVEPFRLNSMEIYNKLNSSPLLDELVNYYHKTNLQDKYLEKSIVYVIIELLKFENKEKPISHFLELFSKKILDSISPATIVTKKEDSVLEFKSRDYFTGKNEQIAERLAEDIKTKLENFGFKLYIIGVDESSGELDLIPSGRIQNDRLTLIEEMVKQKLNENGLITNLKLIPIKFDKGYVLSVVVREEIG